MVLKHKLSFFFFFGPSVCACKFLFLLLGRDSANTQNKVQYILGKQLKIVRVMMLTTFLFFKCYLFKILDINHVYYKYSNFIIHITFF